MKLSSARSTPVGGFLPFYIIVFLALLWLGSVKSSAASMSRGFTELLNSVVRIDVIQVNYEGGSKRFDGSIGSGVILTPDGLILTNAHVVSPKAVEVTVTLSNLENVSAKLVGWDHWTDLALLKIDMDEVKRRNLTFTHAGFGNSGKLFAGQTVYAVGTPFGLTRTVTRGIVSNISQYFDAERNEDGYETGLFNTWLQTDAAINPGNSGGPLVTEDGKVVGITTRGYTGANNLGFAIPSNTAKEIVAELLKSGSIIRSTIGIVPGALQDLEDFYALALNTGMLVNSVYPQSPASLAGVKAGDILLELNHNKVDGRFPEQIPTILNTIAKLPVGSQLTMTIKRGAKIIDIPVFTEVLESSVGEEGAFDKWGLTVRKISRVYAREHGRSDQNGVIVLGVQPGFPADTAGISSGDIISAINRIPISSLEVIVHAHTNYALKPEATLLEVEKDRHVSFVILKP